MISSVLNDLCQNNNFGFLALIDPDLKNDKILDQIIITVNNNNFSAVLVGGSSISDKKYEERLKKIKSSINKPIILFPGSSEQISKFADAILFTSLLSGRNPKYLIDEQVKGVKLIKKYNLPVIPTGYFLLGTNSKTSVEKSVNVAPETPNPSPVTFPEIEISPEGAASIFTLSIEPLDEIVKLSLIER